MRKSLDDQAINESAYKKRRKRFFFGASSGLFYLVVYLEECTTIFLTRRIVK
ncbi:MAG TPA: hypothetical protein GX706_03435 [Candidatus Moranbacteria bacterium]|nr:hypothetical protein [Candidatus Moranbacteria bacterium]